MLSHAEVPVHFALLCPMTGIWDTGRRIAGAAELAVQRVNADKTLHTRLEYSFADSGCSAKQGLAAMGELLGGRNKIFAVIGPGGTCMLHKRTHAMALELGKIRCMHA